MMQDRQHRILVRARVDPDAKTEFYRYVSMSLFPRDIGAAFGDLAHFGAEIVASGMSLRQAREILRILAHDRKLQQRVAKNLGRQTMKLVREKIAALYGEPQK